MEEGVITMDELLDAINRGEVIIRKVHGQQRVLLPAKFWTRGEEHDFYIPLDGL